MDAHDSRELQKLLKDRTKAEAKGRFKEVAGLCNCIGELYSKYEQYEDAIVEHKRERTVSENVSDDMGVAVACRKLGECYVSLEQFDKALPLLKQYLDLSKTCGEHNDVQRAWTTIGRMFLCQIDSPCSTLSSNEASRKAEDAFVKSLEVCEHLKSSIKVEELMDMKARSFLNLGCVYDIRGETTKSVEYFKRAISLAEKYRLYEVVYLCQVNLSAMYERNGKVSEALRCLDVAINTSQKLKDKFKHSEALLQKAQLQISIGDYEASKHGLKKVKKLGLTRDADYLKMNKLYKAACKMKESIDDLEKVDDPKYRIKLYDTLGDCAVDAFNYKQALVYYHKVLELGIDLGLENKEMVPIYVSLARTYTDNKNYVEAIKYYKAELACYKDNREQTGSTWLNIADLEEKLNLGYNKISQSYNEAFKAVRKTTNRKLQLAVLNSLAETQKYYKQSSHLVKTEDKIKTLREKFSSELDDISDEESQPMESNDEETVIMSDLSDSDEDEGEETVMLTSTTSNSNGTRCSRRSTFKIKKNEKGETPLHRACIENNLKKVKKLIEQGHPVNPRDNSGWIPLHEAANYNYYPIVEYLLDHGAHIDDRGGDMCRGVTPLIDAAENGNFETIELLVNRGANKLAKNDDGNKALDCLLEWKERQEDLDTDTEIQFNSILKLLHNGTGSATKLYTKSPKPPANSTTQSVDSFIQYSSDEENLPDPFGNEKSQRLRRISALKKAPKALIAEDSEPEINVPDCNDSQEIYRSAILDDINDNVLSATDNYKSAISLVRTSAQNVPTQIPKLAQKHKPSDPTESNALIGEDNFVGDDWLIDDVGPIKRKFRDCDGFMSGNSTRSASKTKNKRQRIDSDNDETVDLDNLSDIADSDHVSVTPDNLYDVIDDFIQIDDTSPDTLPTLQTFPTRKSQKNLSLKRKPKQMRLTSFGVNSSRRESSQTSFCRSSNSNNFEAWESDSSNSMDAASSIFGNNSTQSTNFGLSAVSAISSIASVNPTGTQPMGSVMRLKVKVKDKVLLIPVQNSHQHNNINWLCQEISQRYYSLYGLRPLLTLSTIEGAIFTPEDIISMVLVHNDELTGNIDSWDLPPLHQRYRQACKTLNTVVYSNICNILQTSETSGRLVLRDLALRSTQLQPIFRALQGTNNLTVFNLQGNRMGDNGVENLSKIFEALPNLTTLNLACNNISSIGLKHIVDSLQKTGDNKALQLLSSFNIKCNILGDSCIPSLASLVSSLPSLTTLNLSSCLLTSNCFQHHRIILANSLTASNLEELDVSYNKFGTLGVELLLKCLNNQKLRVLKLSHIQQGSSSSQLSLHLQQFISQPECCLEELDISACNLSTDDLHFITRLPASCPRIHKLTISKNNRITNQTLQQLLHQTVLESSSKLDEIIVNGCSVKSPLDTDFLDALSDIVNRDSPLRYLSLTCDDLDKVDTDCVKQIWEEKWKNVSKMNIEGNLIELSVCENNS